MSARRRFAWVLNLDAEFELEKPSFNATDRLLEQLRTFGAASRALLGPDDVLIRDGVPDPSAFIGRAWCPTPRALAAMRAARITPEPHPSAAVLRRVNHRRFAVELGGGLPRQRYVPTRSELDALLARADRPLLLKRPLAFAGRGQMRFYGSLDAKQSAWIDASLRSNDGGLVIEPLVEPSAEFSLHGFIWQDGRFELGRICRQEISERGVFRAIRLATSDELSPLERNALEQRAALVAAALANSDYFGPFGIDAYRYQLDGAIDFCSLSEINARYSMGFVTGFPRHPSDLHVAD